MFYKNMPLTLPKIKSKHTHSKVQTAINSPDSCQLIAATALTGRLW